MELRIEERLGVPDVVGGCRGDVLEGQVLEVLGRPEDVHVGVVDGKEGGQIAVRSEPLFLISGSVLGEIVSPLRSAFIAGSGVPSRWMCSSAFGRSRTKSLTQPREVISMVMAWSSDPLGHALVVRLGAGLHDGGLDLASDLATDLLGHPGGFQCG